MKQSKSNRANLIFPVGRMKRKLKSKGFERVRTDAPIFLAATLEYLMAEMMDLSGQAAKQNKRKRIIPRHIQLAIQNDEELSQLLDQVLFPSAGVLPRIHGLLLPKRSSVRPDHRPKAHNIDCMQVYHFFHPKTESSLLLRMDIDAEEYLNKYMGTIERKELEKKEFGIHQIEKHVKPYSFVVRPTKGSFYDETYSDKAWLHVGLTDSRGEYVYNFDHVHRKDSVALGGWINVLNFSLEDVLDDLEEDWKSRYDKVLEDVFLLDTKTQTYHILHNNCFSFVIRVLNALVKDERFEKYSFVDKYILKRVQIISSLLAINREVLKNGFHYIPPRKPIQEECFDKDSKSSKE